MTGDEEEHCSEVDMYSECKLELSNSDEISFYAKLYNIAVVLTQLFAAQESKDKAKETEEWLTKASDGLVLACIASATTGEPCSDGVDTEIFNDIRLNPPAGNLDLKRIGDDLHIADASLNSTYPSEAMCEFRGRVRAVLIKIIIVRRVCPAMVSNFVAQFERRVTTLKDWAERVSGQSIRTAGLRPVHGTLRSDSYVSVPGCVCNFCKASLVEASNNGVNLSLLLDAHVNSSSTKKTGKKGQKNKNNVPSPDGPRIRKKSSLFTFLPTH